MSTNQFITHQNLLKLLGTLASGTTELVAPVKIGERRFFAPVTDVHAICFDPLPTAESPKFLLLPRAEQLLSYERNGEGIRLHDRSADALPERILFGARPCDAAGLQRLSDFFAAEITDAFVPKRREHLTIISLSCASADGDCFCTSTGSGPGDTTGSDVLLTPIGNDRYIVECLTDNGRKLLEASAAVVEEGPAIDKQPFLAAVKSEPAFDGFAKNLAGAFAHPVWRDAALRCLGCGACAYVCPVCSCFSIEDEGSPAKGDRLRCWDSCGFGQFTLHTSGHNPRPTQSDRWRQRIMHKFSYMPERFGFTGCVGCGRCSRACPADMNLKEHVVQTASRISTQEAS
jgi:sulfhydrogenase subunit beta (sulfur reductase)